MRKMKFLLNLFVCLSFFSCFSYDTVDSLRSTFTIEDDTLTTATGEKHFRYPFESKLHFDLAYYMKDLMASHIVHEAYKNHILPIVVKISEDENSYAANEAFTKALIEMCLLLGNSRCSPEQSLISALLHQNKYGEKWVSEYLTEIKDFIKEANSPLYLLPQKKTGAFKIIIVTTTVSGGNYAVAESMANHLEKNKNIQTLLIDVEDIAKEVDPLIIATGIYTYDKVYSSIFQKTNDFNALTERKKLNKEIQQYIPSMLLAKLKQKIAAINPDLIISTRSYTSDDLALASLGIPLRLFHPDFELCSSLCSYYRSIAPESIRFWLPILSASMFKPLYEKYNRLDLYNEKDDKNTFLNKLSDFLKIPCVDLKKQFEVIGYPCSSFFRIDEKCRLNELRQKWGINEGDIPVFIVMGKHGTKSIQEIFDQLIIAKSELPLKYLFVCGKNTDLLRDLKEKINYLQIEKDRFIIHGLLKPAEMNEIMNISAIGISKAGGATVIEALMTRCPLLLMHSYPWEEINASYLMEVGLATKYDSTKGLVEQIESCVRANRYDVRNDKEVENWREQLDFYVDTLIKNK